MNPDRWQQIGQLYRTALELEPEMSYRREFRSSVIPVL